MSHVLAEQVTAFSKERDISVSKIFQEADVGYHNYFTWKKNGSNARMDLQRKVLNAMARLSKGPSITAADLKQLGSPAPLPPGFNPKPAAKALRKAYTLAKLPKDKNPAYAALKSFFAATSNQPWTGTTAQLQEQLSRHSLTPLPSAKHIFMRRVKSAMIDLKREGFSLKSRWTSVLGKMVLHYVLTAPKAQTKHFMTGMAIVKGSPLLSLDPLVLRLATEEKALKTKKEQIAALQKDCAQTQQLVDALRTVIRRTSK